MLDHLVSRYHLVLVLGVWQTGIGQVEGSIQFLGSHRGIGRVHHGVASFHLLYQSLGMYLVGFLLDMAEVFRFGPFVAQAFLMTVQDDVLFIDAFGNILFQR